MEDNTLLKKHNRRNSMDSISLPDEETINKLNRPKITGRSVNAKADQIFDGYHTRRIGNFDAASKFYGTEHEKKLELEGEEDPEDSFIPKPDPNKKAPSHMEMGVKVGDTYVQRKRIFIWIGAALLILILALLFLPPIMSSMAEDTAVLYERNVFEDMGMTEFRSYALANYSVYDESAFSSEKMENYRIIQLKAHIQNSTPFEIKIPQYKIAHVGSEYKKRICYVTSTHTDMDGAVDGDTIPGFSGADVTLEIMVNVEDMTDEELDDCITGLIISTKDMKKKIAGNTYVPCIPAVLFVSNNVSVSVEP